MAEQSRGTQSSRLLATPPPLADPYTLEACGIFQPPTPVVHRDEEYPSEGFNALVAMQRDHFWYRGRHRFILHFTRKIVALSQKRAGLEAIDLGAGCGGWVNYLSHHEPNMFRLSIGDSSMLALELAKPFVSSDVGRYQIDLLNLQWSCRWDVAFMLDVLEHIPDDVRALREVRAALRPGGLLITTTPALERFRTAIDDMSHHVRRYSRNDLARRAADANLELVTTRYFMFFLSPLLLLSRRHIPDAATLSPAETREYMRKSAEIPAAPINSALSLIFNLETPLGAWMPFPWGTSVLAVFRKPKG
jgi:SAM-dependent methyltransferase